MGMKLYSESSEGCSSRFALLQKTLRFWKKSVRTDVNKKRNRSCNGRVDGSVALSETELNCLQCLRTSEYEAFRRRNPDRTPGTCEWFLMHKKNQSWRNEQSSSLLWVFANPGCGKSVLAATLVEELRRSVSQDVMRGIVCQIIFLRR